jgi:hypothetical protein
MGRKGLIKYFLWGCVVLARITIGDSLLDWRVWTYKTWTRPLLRFLERASV